MPIKNLLSLSLPTKANDTRSVGNLTGSSLALAIAEIEQQHQGPIIVAVTEPQLAFRLQNEINQFSQNAVDVFPDWETLPYDSFSPHQDIISDRLSRLYHLPQQKNGTLIVPISTLLQRQSPQSFLHKHALVVNVGDRLSFDKLKLQLEKSGYLHVDQVMSHGEYASRGSIIDLFPMGNGHPFRIDFLMMKLIQFVNLILKINVRLKKLNQSTYCQLMNFQPMMRQLKIFVFAGVNALMLDVNQNLYISRSVKVHGLLVSNIGNHCFLMKQRPCLITYLTTHYWLLLVILRRQQTIS